MDTLSSSGHFGKTRLRQLNYCRLYLCVMFLSELVTADGTHLIDGFWKGDFDRRTSSALFRYPRQSRPSDKIWSFWRSAIRLVFCHPRCTTLRQPLLDWTSQPHHRYTSVTTDPLRLWCSATSYHEIERSTRHKLIFSTVQYPGILPSNSTPVDILASTASTITTSIPRPRLHNPIPPSPSNFEDRLQSLEAWQDSLLHNLEHHCPRVDVMSHLSCPFGSVTDILAATDGGAKQKVGSFAWTIRLDDCDIASCSGPVSGLSPGSFRSECYAVLSLLLYLHLLLCDQPQPLPYCQLTVHLDCQSLITKLRLHQNREFFTPREAISSERDVLLQIEHYLDLLAISFDFQFVKGHQDNDKQPHQLDSAALANICADSLATSALESATPSASVSLFPASQCQLVVRGSVITRNVANQIRHAVYEQPMRDFITSSRAWTFTCDIDWHHYSTFCNRNYRRPLFWLKWTHRLLPIGHVVHRQNPRDSPNCPACETYEDHDHLLSCTHPSRHSLQRKLMTELRTHLDWNRYDPILCDILVEGVSSVLHSQPFDLAKFPSRYQPLCQSQSNLGWSNLLRGFCSIHWRQLQNDFFRNHSQPVMLDKLGVLSALHAVIDSIQSIWLFRNQQRHGADTDQHQSEVSRQTIDTIVDLYELRDRVLPCDKHLFHSSIDDHLSKPQSSLRAWVSNHADQLFRSHQQALKDNVTNTHSLTTYFS